jgi:hypothetical protein
MNAQLNSQDLLVLLHIRVVVVLERRTSRDKISILMKTRTLFTIKMTWQGYWLEERSLESRWTKHWTLMSHGRHCMGHMLYPRSTYRLFSVLKMRWLKASQMKSTDYMNLKLNASLIKKMIGKGDRIELPQIPRRRKKKPQSLNSKMYKVLGTLVK